MRALAGLTATASLFSTVAPMLVHGGSLFAILTFGLFMLALVGVLA